MRKVLVLILISVAALFLRLYRLPEQAKFGYDEARDAAVIRQITTERRLTLLGPETKIGDWTIYFGPLHYYLLAPALVISNFDPLGPYVWTAILGSVTTVIIYLVTRNILAAVFYAVFPLAVIFNRWAWNPNTVPLFSALSLLFFKKKHFFWSGLFLGLASQLHSTAILLLFFLRANLPRLIVGLVVGLSPMILFDLRHDFLYFRSFLGLFSSDPSYRSFNWHYFLWAIPLICLWFSSWPKKIQLLIIVVSLTFSLYWLASQPQSISQNPKTISAISALIASDQQDSDLSFNVASFVDPDTRATAYRYFLEIEGVKPLGVAEYDVADHLYVVTFDDKTSVLYNQTYEIKSFRPTRVSRSWQIAGENIFRLEKN